MDFYEWPEEKRQATGIDYDLAGALEYNPQEGWTLDDIARVLAVVEGEKDEAEWYWIVRLNDGRFVFASGGCDYTGWDCQSHLDSSFYPTVEEALADTPEKEDSVYRDNRVIRAELARQVDEEKATTWREAKDKEFDL